VSDFTINEALRLVGRSKNTNVAEHRTLGDIHDGCREEADGKKAQKQAEERTESDVAVPSLSSSARTMEDVSEDETVRTAEPTTRKAARAIASCQTNRLAEAMRDPEAKAETSTNDDEAEETLLWRNRDVPIAERINHWNRHLHRVASTIREAVKDLRPFGPMSANQIDIIQSKARELSALIRACRAHEACNACRGSGTNCQECGRSGMLSRRQAETAGR
jgi:hypothetical protein